VAATERRVRHARRRRGRRRLIRELPWLAAGLGAIAAREAAGQSFIDTRVLYYKESGDRTEVLNPNVLVHQDLGPTWGTLDLHLAYDAISGASPTGGYPTLDVTTSASGKTVAGGSVPVAKYHDARKAGTLSYSNKFGAHLPSIDVSYSKENDYTARSFGLSDAWTMAQGRGTLHYGFSIARDIVAPVTNDLRLDKSTNGYALGWTWIVGERDLVDVSGTLLNLSGYLDDPYKIVPIGPTAAGSSPDHRPDTRSRRALLAKYGHYFPWDGALKVTYRYYWDDWAVKGHTLDLLYDQKLGSDWIVSPEIRLYTQGAASFYGSRFVTPQPYMSADYRLSPMDSILGGLGASRKLDDRTSVNAGVTFQSQTGRDRLTPLATSPTATRVTSTSPADLTVVTVTLGFTFSY
jgi:hypothetical protein